MKNKGFTLIELLAVIVILAIIALIAIPIILNIINSTKTSANERSKELYLDAVEQAIARKNLTEKNGYNPTECTVNGTGNLDCKNDGGDLSDLTVEVNGIKPDEGSKITFENGKITSSNLKFSNETQKEEPVSKICTLASDSEKQGYEIGAKYTCSLDKERTFYVLETSGDNVSLLMEQNFTDGDGTNGTIPPTVALWTAAS